MPIRDTNTTALLLFSARALPARRLERRPPAAHPDGRAAHVRPGAHVVVPDARLHACLCRRAHPQLDAHAVRVERRRGSCWRCASSAAASVGLDQPAAEPQPQPDAQREHQLQLHHAVRRSQPLRGARLARKIVVLSPFLSSAERCALADQLKHFSMHILDRLKRVRITINMQNGHRPPHSIQPQQLALSQVPDRLSFSSFLVLFTLSFHCTSTHIHTVVDVRLNYRTLHIHNSSHFNRDPLETGQNAAPLLKW